MTSASVPRLRAALVCALFAAPAPLLAQAPPEVPVTAARARRQDVPVLLHAIGTVQAWQTVLVRARVDGTLDKLGFTEGQDVKPGDLLAQIDPRPYQAALDAALAKRAADQAQLDNARQDLARYADVARSGFETRQRVDTQRAAVAQGEAGLQGDDAAIATARLNLGFTTVTAPIEGRVGLRQVDVGNQIHASDSQGIVSINQVHPIAVLFTLPQDQLPEVQTALRAEKLPVQAFTGDDRTLLSRGALLTVDNAIDAATGTIRLKAVFANADDHLWPGQFVNVRLQLTTRKNALTIPSDAVQHGPDGLYAYVIKPDNTAVVQRIEVTQDDNGVAVVGKGLDDGTQVVVAGQSRLANGTRVAVSDAKAAGG